MPRWVLFTPCGTTFLKSFDDYIATPKENGYQSLHTAVVGPGGKTLEVQIRTHAMHEEAELGVCAHWKYKGTDTKSESDSYEEKLNWLRQVLDWQEEIGQGMEGLADQWRLDVEPDRVYVFTPVRARCGLTYGCNTGRFCLSGAY